MNVIGRIETGQLAEMEHRGVELKDAVNMVLAEAKARYPDAGEVVIQQNHAQNCFDIIALQPTLPPKSGLLKPTA
jgi:hypothetical protein